MKKYFSLALLLLIVVLFSCTKSKECPEEQTILNSVNKKLDLMNAAQVKFLLTGSRADCYEMARYYEEAIEEIKKWEGCAEKYGYSQQEWRSIVQNSEYFKDLIRANCS